ncbi:MAG: hypothetical protein ABSB22_12630 [Thermodesulfobacteriota bacterium]
METNFFTASQLLWVVSIKETLPGQGGLRFCVSGIGPSIPDRVDYTYDEKK